MHKVFVSYSSREADRAYEIVTQLEAAGIPCWIAPRDIGVGSNYTRDIPKAIRECTHFLLALSANAEASKWVNKELTRAINQEKCLIPLMIEDFTISEGFEFLLEDVQIRNYCNDCQGVLREVIRLFPDAAPAASVVNPVQDEITAEEYYQKGLNAFNSQQYIEAVIWYRKAADLGHEKAQFALARCYDYGNGVEKNPNEAVNWFLKAAEQGDAPAQNCLGYCYQMGHGVEKDISKAIKWFQKAADYGDMYAQCNLASCYEWGHGVDKDPGKAIKWYKKAADQDFADAQCHLGYCYETGNIVETDFEEAAKWYTRATGNGSEYAKTALERLK